MTQEVSLLPFIKKKNEGSVAGLIIKSRTPDEKPEESQEDKSTAIEACAQALINAIHSNNVKGTADALCDAFEILENLPHEEAEHVDPHSYNAQNIKALTERKD